MRYLNMRLRNYGGILNGMGLDEIVIDFTKATHKLILIRGDNGSGKSTIYKAIHPLPDSNDCFVPGHIAEKELEILDGDNHYKILFIHGIKSNGDRDTTKGYILKNGVELNPNGNISSFKDTIYSEFNLDSNFIALSQLSSDNRGIADKRPAERKRYVNMILDTLESYNNIYKALNKRGNIYKSMINSISSKLDSIGDLGKLKSVEKDNQVRLDSLNKERDNLITSLNLLKLQLQQIDPGNTIVDEHKRLVDCLKRTTKDLDKATMLYEKQLSEIGLSKNDDLNIYKANIEGQRDKLTAVLQACDAKIKRLLNDKEEQARNLQEKSSKLASYQYDSTIDQLQSSLALINSKINKCRELFSNIGIDIDTSTISKDEYIMALNCLKSIKDTVDRFRSNYDYHIIEQAITFIVTPDSSPEPESYFNDAIEGLYRKLSSISDELTKYNMLAQVASKLEMRPKGCKIDGCEFIKDAILASKENPVEKIRELEEDKKMYTDNLNNMTKRRVENKNIWTCMDEIYAIIKDIKSHKSVLSKIPNGETYSNVGKMLELIRTGNIFDDIQQLYNHLDYANILEEYKSYIKSRDRIENDLAICQNRIKIIEDLSEDINRINSELDLIKNEIDKMNIELQETRDAISSRSLLLVNIDSAITLKENYDRLFNESTIINNQLEENNKKMQDIPKILSEINDIETKIQNIANLINPLMNERDKIKHQLMMAKEYSEELKDYKANYEVIEKLKHYSSPTTGIQLVFMDLYMNKVISMANKLLALLFDGNFVLQQFVINETEFRIPCCGNRIMNDDISSMSTAQICMISMILSFAFLFHSSTKYNILKLDEIDGALDTNNRLGFVNVLNQLCDMLETEQCIIISHNDEFDTSEADIILLKHSHPETINGNIIFKY